MPELQWQKSSYSGGPEGNCLYLAPSPDGTIRLRESDTPDVILSTTQETLTSLLRHLKQD
ncbi:DUF397 domain-containing protein [Streptomyces sp. ME18-1-4]|uniref:DUF397 domain-containing protein n=1 Tax=Streptomyces sp. ME18-1-4 TaxID=3028685 RepID=UPI0029AB9384|nr:DUF397 domain-containing protein [Streptomyces sp. ME18-1-4]MDX3248272.1 DUF397 domain-containing protein [Streptomyces sp. ME18-1-4]